MNNIPKLFSQQRPIYDIERSYAENIAEGPFFAADIPARPSRCQTVSFLGLTLSSPIGIPAGPLLNSRWIQLAAQLGFDLLTYKTIRSQPHLGHPLPNMIFVETNLQGARRIAQPNEFDRFTLTNSFGMPSQPREFLLKDIAQALSFLKKGQAMIVSVVGTPGGKSDLTSDFISAAMIARDAGAPLIEANFSCPNVSTKEGLLFLDPEGVFSIASAIVRAIAPVPLILKVGVFPKGDLLQKVLHAAARAGVRAICGLNSVSMAVVDATGRPALGDSRPTSGVCGSAIRKTALQWIRDAAAIIRKDKLDLTIMGCGGLMIPAHFDECLAAGAQIAMTATAMMWDPFLALRYHWRQ